MIHSCKGHTVMEGSFRGAGRLSFQEIRINLDMIILSLFIGLSASHSPLVWRKGPGSLRTPYCVCEIFTPYMTVSDKDIYEYSLYSEME